jgi:hypothetical protein
MFRRLFEWLLKSSERRYDQVRVINPIDGTVINGHDAVKAHFEKEQNLLNEHGASIIFQVFRINTTAKTLDELQGDKLAEIKLDGNFVSGNDSVSAVKDKLQPVLQQQGNISINEEESITLLLNGRSMQDTSLFYADNFISLPVWVQIFIHQGSFAQVISRADEIKRDTQR